MEEAPDAAPIPTIHGTGEGSCSATYTLASGETYSTVISFFPVGLHCAGSDQCGGTIEDIESDAGFWFIDNCADASSYEPTPEDASGDADAGGLDDG